MSQTAIYLDTPGGLWFVGQVPRRKAVSRNSASSETGHAGDLWKSNCRSGFGICGRAPRFGHL